MRKLTLDETWDYTKRMWKWIAFQVEVLKDKRSVVLLKETWLKENAPEFVNITSSCFFCAAQDDGCIGCPGKLVGVFNCCDPEYHYNEKPGAFYREILRLDEIRTAAPPEHVWVHGDVFKNSVCGDWIYLEPGGVPRVMCITRPEGDSDTGSTPDLQLFTATFLFNIKDRL